MSVTSSPSNARLPVSISYSTHAERPDVAALVHGLARAPAPGSCTRPCRGSSRACIIAGDVIVGDMRHARRHRAPVGSIAFARPKSSTFTVPSGRTLMFAGLRSRWMMPCSCAASSASAICFAIGSASSSRDRALRDPIRERRPLDQFHHQRGACRRIAPARRSPAMFG